MCFVGVSEFQAPAQRKPGLGDRRTGGAAGVSGDGQCLSQVGRGVRAGVMEMGQVQVRKDLCCLVESREEALRGVTEQSHVRGCVWANLLRLGKSSSVNWQEEGSEAGNRQGFDRRHWSLPFAVLARHPARGQF